MADQDLPGYAPDRPLWQPPGVIPSGSLAELARAVQTALQGVAVALQQLGQRRNMLPLQGDLSARVGQVISGIAAGQVITLPAPDPGQYGTLTAIVSGVKSAATVVSPDGSKFTLDQVGLYEFAISPDDTTWRAAPWLTAAGVGFTWSQVLNSGANSGAHDPIIDVGRFLQLGAVGPTANNPQIRSGDLVFRIRAGGSLSCGGVTGAVFFSTGGNTEVGADAGGGSVILSTATLGRLVISSAGEWTTPTGGALGKYIRHAGAGAPPTWANVAIGELTAINANTIVANATAASAAPAELAVGANTVVGRVAGNLVAAQLVNAQITANTITAASQAQMAANSIKGNATAASANEADQALAVQSILLRAAANIVNAACAADQVLGRVGSGDLGFGPTPRLLRAPQILTSGTSISHPTGTRVLKVRGVGGGGAGGGANAAAGAIGGQGGSGTYGEKTYLAPAASSTYAIGAAGAGVSGAAGGAGGSSTFTNNAVTITCPGGNGGGVAVGGATQVGALGGAAASAATGADFSISGQAGSDACRPAAATAPNLHLGHAGSNPLGKGAPGRFSLGGQIAGIVGTGNGAGGSGVLNSTAATAAAGGAGTIGCWIVEEWG